MLQTRHDVVQAVQDAALVISQPPRRYPELHSLKDCRNRQRERLRVGAESRDADARGRLYRVSQRSGAERYANLIPDRKETGLESILRSVLVYWHT